MNAKHKANKIKRWRLYAVGRLALLSSKFAHSFHAQFCFAGIASTQSLEKNKNLLRSKFLSAVDTQSFRSVFTFGFYVKFYEMISQSSEISVLKKLEKFTTKLIKIFNSAI